MKFIKLILGFIALHFLTGCVVGTRMIELPAPDAAMNAGASGEIYIASIVDNRTFEQAPSSPSTPSVDGDLASTSAEQLSQLIGRQRNGYGKAMGDVALPEGQSVVTKMRELLTKALEARGYNVSNNSSAAKVLDVTIQEFWAWFSPGFWSVSFESRLAVNLEVTNNSDKTNISAKGYGRNNGQVASDANWQLAYERGIRAFYEDLDSKLAEAGL